MIQAQAPTKDVVKTASPAKLNLTFDIIGSLPDGYHEVVTIMQAIDLEDSLVFDFQPADQFTLQLSANYVGSPGTMPLDDSNLVAKSVHLFNQHVAPAPYHLKVTIEKKIPITAGMGGGSSNAAAALTALNYHFGKPVPDVDLETLAAKLGADVPFFLRGGTQIGLRRGDMLTPTPLAGILKFVIAHPTGCEIPTTWVYQAYDRYIEQEDQQEDQQYQGQEIKSQKEPATRSRFNRPDLYDCKDALAKHDLALAKKAFGNVFEPIVFEKYEVLSLLCDRMLALGCLTSHLTGSGPTIYGLVADREAAKAVIDGLNMDLAEPKRAAWSAAGDLTLSTWMVDAIPYGVRKLEF